MTFPRRETPWGAIYLTLGMVAAFVGLTIYRHGGTGVWAIATFCGGFLALCVAVLVVIRVLSGAGERLDSRASRRALERVFAESDRLEADPSAPLPSKETWEGWVREVDGAEVRDARDELMKRLVPGRRWPLAVAELAGRTFASSPELTRALADCLAAIDPAERPPAALRHLTRDGELEPLRDVVLPAFCAGAGRNESIAALVDRAERRARVDGERDLAELLRPHAELLTERVGSTSRAAQTLTELLSDGDGGDPE